MLLLAGLIADAEQKKRWGLPAACHAVVIYDRLTVGRRSAAEEAGGDLLGSDVPFQRAGLDTGRGTL